MTSARRDPRAVAFGSRVKALRKKRGWTLVSMAKKAKVHHTYLGQMERGERNPSLFTILHLGDVLGVPPGALLDGIPPDPSDGASGHPGPSPKSQNEQKGERRPNRPPNDVRHPPQ